MLHGYTIYYYTYNKVIHIITNSGDWLQPGKDNQKYSMILVWGHNPGTKSYGTSECLVRSLCV